jgi:hypothetical protein
LDRAESLYLKALKIKTKYDLSEVHYQLIAIAIQKNEIRLIQKYVDQASLVSHKLKEGTIAYLNVVKYIYLNDQSLKISDFGGLDQSIYKKLFLWKKTNDLVKAGKYDLAYESLKGSDFSNADIILQTTYDVVRTLSLKKKMTHKQLLCSKTYKEKNIKSYTAHICRIIKQYISKGKVRVEEVGQLKKLLMKSSPDKIFLVKAILDLNK